MRIPNLAVSAVFVALIAAPFGSALLAAASNAGSSARTAAAEPIAATRLLTEEKYRDGLIRDAVLASPVGAESVRVKAWLDYRVFSYADRPQVVSGIDGWLFYKGDFDGGRCRQQAVLDRTLDTVDVAWELAAAIGIDFRLSVAPDKSVVYPDRLGARANALAGCKLQSAAIWRAQAARRDSPWLIDHLAALRGMREQIYYATDTHWNDLGFAAGFAQLVKAYRGVSLPAPASAAGVAGTRETDLLRLIGLNATEPSLDFGGFFAAEWPRLIGAPLPGKTVVIYDSFFNDRRQEVSHLFGDADMFSMTWDEKAITPAVARRPQRILMETVERLFFQRVDLVVGWQGLLGKGLHQAIADAASSCRFEALAPAGLKLRDIARTGVDWQLSGHDPQVEITLPPGTGRVCLRATYGGAKGQTAEIFLPDPRRGNPRFRQSRSIPYAIAGEDATVSIVLPEGYRGQNIRLDPARDALRLTNVRLEVGTFDPSGDPSGDPPGAPAAP